MGVSLVNAGPIAQGLFGLIDNLFTSEDERLAAKFKILELEKSGELAQITVNSKEAEHPNVFVAGWRPYVGWIGGTSLLFLAVCMVATALGYVEPEVFQVLSAGFMTTTLPILGGMLGLRTFDKYKGTATNNFRSDGVDRRANAGV